MTNKNGRFADEVLTYKDVEISIEDWSDCEKISNKKWRAILNGGTPKWEVVFGSTRNDAYDNALELVRKNQGLELDVEEEETSYLLRLRNSLLDQKAINFNCRIGAKIQNINVEFELRKTIENLHLLSGSQKMRFKKAIG